MHGMTLSTYQVRLLVGLKKILKSRFQNGSNCVVRNGSFIGRGAVIMPNSFINIGGYCGEKSMVDTGARIGSCARIGANCHLSAGVGLGKITKPVGSKPTIIEDDCFIGALSEIVEGVIVRNKVLFRWAALLENPLKL